MKKLFHRFATIVSTITGSPIAFVSALLLVIVWGFSGDLFGYSNTWQLAINTGTTIVTFLMVFLIQNTQNRDSKAMQLKLDELIRVSGKARDSFLDLEDMSDEEIADLNSEFHQIHEQHSGSPVIHKLHKKIKAEHERRSIRHPFAK